MVQAWTEDSQVPLSENPEVKHMPREQQAHSVWLRQHREHPLALLKCQWGTKSEPGLGQQSSPAWGRQKEAGKREGPVAECWRRCRPRGNVLVLWDYQQEGWGWRAAQSLLDGLPCDSAMVGMGNAFREERRWGQGSVQVGVDLTPGLSSDTVSSASVVSSADTKALEACMWVEARSAAAAWWQHLPPTEQTPLPPPIPAEWGVLTLRTFLKALTGMGPESHSDFKTTVPEWLSQSEIDVWVLLTALLLFITTEFHILI